MRSWSLVWRSAPGLIYHSFLNPKKTTTSDAKFINDYGTHYITSGSMGGVYEYILVLNKEKMETAR